MLSTVSARAPRSSRSTPGDRRGTHLYQIDIAARGTVVSRHARLREAPERAGAGSIPHTLDIFRSEVRFYRDVAPEAGVRVPACYAAEITDGGTLLILEDLSSWRAGADPEAAARLLAAMHARWSGRAPLRWPWLRPVGAAADQVEALYGDTWPALAARQDLTPPVRDLAARLVGRNRLRRRARTRRPLTLAHGDASLAEHRTSPAAEIALLDWEDVSAAPGIADLAWLLVSSVEPARWPGVITAYGTAARLGDVLPAAAVQGLLELSDTPDGSADGSAWLARLHVCAAVSLRMTRRDSGPTGLRSYGAPASLAKPGGTVGVTVARLAVVGARKPKRSVMVSPPGVRATIRIGR